jgi:hypothetical protein
MKGKMKGAALLVFLLTAWLPTVGQHACMASSSDTAGTLLKAQSRQNRPCPAPRLLFAVRADTEDRITYGTDPDMERAMEEQDKLEKEKEDKAWEMLQHMNIYQRGCTGTAKPPVSTQPDSSPQK